MDLQKCIATLYSVFIVCLIAAGIAHAQWNGDQNDLEVDGNTGVREIQPWGYATNPDDGYAANMLANVLKRNTYGANYRRLPRLKQQRIIPFYSFGNDFLKYRTMPSHGGKVRTPYFFTPWSFENYRPSKIQNTRIYSGY